MSLKSGLKLQSLILIVMIPILTLSTILYAYFVYQNVYSGILEGFNRKLFAASSTSGAFIDGDMHSRIFEPKIIRGIVLKPSQDGQTLIGLDSLNGNIVRLSEEAGEASELTKLGLDPTELATTNDISYLTKEQKLITVASDRNILLEIDSNNGQVSKRLQLTSNKPLQPLIGIEYVAKTDSIYFSNTNLYKLNKKNNKLDLVGKLSDQIVSALSWNSESEQLFGVESLSGKLLKIDLNNAEKSVLGTIEPSSIEEPKTIAAVAEPEAWTEPQIVILPVYGLAANAEGFFATTDRLIKWDGASKMASAANFRKGFRNDESATYLGMVKPMRKILKNLGLTYHYTVVPLAGNTMAYVLDATEGEEHSLSGTEEENTDQETQRLNTAMKEGQVSLSEIEYFEKWGLLKVGTAPIFNSKNEVKALAGADVNISVINTKTRTALLQVFGVGVLALIFALFASLLIAKKLIEPITSLKEAALKVAANNFDYNLQVANPKELKDLSDSFKSASTLLLDSGVELHKQNSAYEQARRQQELLKLLNYGLNLTNLNMPSNFESKDIDINVTNINSSTSGWVDQNGWIVVWIVEEKRDEIENARSLSDLRTISTKILNKFYADSEELEVELRRYLSDMTVLVLLINKAEGVIKTLNGESRVLGQIWSDKKQDKLELHEAATLPLNQGDSLFIALNGFSPAIEGGI